MEIFAYWKTMNKQMKCSSILVRLAMAAITAGTWGLSATTTLAQSGVDRIPVTLSDPSRPARVKVSMVNGGITVKGYEGKEVGVEAHAPNGRNCATRGWST